MSRTRDDGSCDYCGGVMPMINGVPCPACDGTGHGGNNGPYDDEPTYMIRRFHFNGPTETIARGLTLDEAQAHCRREDTHGDGWFDGYDEE